MSQIARNIESVRERISRAAAACGRSADEITLLAVTKTFTKESISQAVAAEVQKFGENRVQEAESKILFFREHLKLEWHLIGHLQSNKARRAVELFDVVHSLDGVKIAAKLNKASLEIGKRLPVLLQVDLGGEETKFGADPNQVRAIVEMVSNLDGLQLDGLMTIPPYFENPDQTRPYFRRLREIRDSLESEQPGCLGQQHLSMGMSHDFEAAIEEGATIIRIGTAIFGERLYDR
jgi:pyridoxal phosphate enzyme (YggS family)